MAVTATTPEIGSLELVRKPRSLWRDAFRRLSKNKMAVASAIIILAVTLITISAPLLPLHDPISYHSRATDPGGGGTRLPPAWEANGNTKFLLGTDGNGRDVLSRLIYGAQVSLLVGLIPMSIIVIIGTIVGLTAGFLGGRVDNILMRITDVTYAFPDILFIIIMVGALRGTFLGNLLDGLLVIFVSLAVVGWVGIARLVRGQVLSLKEKEFVEAARSIGVPTWRVMTSHLLPNSLAPLIVAATFAVPGFIIAEAILSYIGLGVRPPRPSWGDMVLAGYSNVNAAPHLIWIPAAAIAVLTLSFTFLGDGLRDALDPRMNE